MKEFLVWIFFTAFFIGLLLIDLFVIQKKAHDDSVKQALKYTAFWIALALLFNVAIWISAGSDVGLKFLTGYLLEKSLSVDNIFVFLLVFSYFNIPLKYQHQVLFYGILGALVLRTIFIFAGVSLIHKFHWIIYLFGAFLIFTGIKLAFEKDKKIEPEKNPVLRLFKKFMPVTKELHGEKFFVKEAGKLVATPLFVVLLVLESTDVIFAVDSIPAILAVTTDFFIVYTSNMFAILGLRSLYFALAAIMKLFHHLHYGLSLILVFVGLKMLASDVFHLPIWAALGFIIFTLVASILASIWFPPKDKAH